MALRIVEFFGYDPLDRSPKASHSRKARFCPFIASQCTKLLRDRSVSGACTVKLSNSAPIICCPNRLYAEEYSILQRVADTAFGTGVRLISGEKVAHVSHDGQFVAVFGKRWGKELRLPQRSGRGGYFVDWILARIGKSGKMSEFVAVEVQAIDTTGNYRAERDAYLRGNEYKSNSNAGLNWENVSKRILPQIIYKGHVLRHEQLCKKGLFFVCPTPVYERVEERLGKSMVSYHFQPGALTFQWYNIGSNVAHGRARNLTFEGEFTTTVDQVALAFTAPANLPPAGVYQRAIESELERLNS
jgi:hypothetical protein